MLRLLAQAKQFKAQCWLSFCNSTNFAAYNPTVRFTLLGYYIIATELLFQYPELRYSRYLGTYYLGDERL